MGSLLTYLYYGNNEPDPVTGLTPKEIGQVKSTWNLCKKDLTGTGVELFLLFLKDYPQYQNYFPFRDIKLEELRNNRLLKAHAASVAYAFTSIVDNADNTDNLVPILHKISESHAKRNIPEKSFTDLKESILKLLEISLGSKFNQDCKTAWSKTLDVAFKVIIDHMKEVTKQ